MRAAQQIEIQRLSAPWVEATRSLILSGLQERFGILKPDYLQVVYELPESYAPPRIMLIALKEGHVVACGAVSPQHDLASTWRIERVSVADTERGQGLGHLMVSELEAQAAALGAARLVLTTLEHWASARRLYERMDYRATGITRHAAPGDEGSFVAVHYEKQLNTGKV